MEENINENKKKQKVALLIGLVTLLIAVLGATYAFFQINTNNESSNTSITGSTPPKSLVTLKGVTSNLHLNISASDMSYDNRTKEYYGTDGEDSYVGTEELGTKTIAEVELKGGEATTKYSCTAKLTVSKVTDPETEKDTMIEVLQPGDMILQFKGDIINEQLDLSELNPSGKKEYNLKFNISGSTPKEIQAYIKLVNKDEPQNYLSGKKLNIDISTSDLKCEVFIPDPKIAQLREDSNGTLSEDVLGDMYRYQGTTEVPNYICFGTTSKDECINEETGIDKYMYRILGINDDGEMKLIKETAVKESDSTQFPWGSTIFFDSYHERDLEVWNKSSLFERLNGISSDEDNIYINNAYYEYLSEGENWNSIIETHKWFYGALEGIGENRNANEIYAKVKKTYKKFVDAKIGCGNRRFIRTRQSNTR